MKKILFVFLCFLFMLNLNAQKNNHEVTLGAGVWSTTEIIDIFGDIFSSILTAGIYQSDKTYSGAFHLGYKYNVSERVGVGGTFVYENAYSDALISNEKKGKFRNNYYTVAAEADFKYIQNNKTTIYGLLGAGTTMMSQFYKPIEGERKNHSMVYFNFQFTPLGIKYGSRYGAFAELGFGYKGILSVGAFGRF